MTYYEFSKVFGSGGIVDIRNVATYFSGFDRRRLYEWQEKGYLRRLSNNFYFFSDHPVDDTFLKTVASVIYSPSYVGLASALAYYGFIPEAVFHTTGITTRRNKKFRTAIGDFTYRTIKPDFFFGYTSVVSHQGTFLISDPEKTLLDWLYFTPSADDAETFNAFRFNYDEIALRVNADRLERYLSLFHSAKLERAVNHFYRHGVFSHD